MSEIIALIYSYGRAAWRRRWWAVIAAWLIAPAAWIVVLMLPDRYEAQAVVFVNGQTALRPVLQGIATPDDSQTQLAKVREAMLARPQLTAVARQTLLDTKVKSAADMDALVRKLQKEIKVSVAAPRTTSSYLQSQDSIYTITYQHSNREKAILVVRTLMDNFQEFAKSGQRTGTGEAQNFLNKQIAEKEKELRDQEQAIADFKSRNPGMAPTGDSGDFFGRLNAERNGAKNDENGLVQSRTKLFELQKQAERVKEGVLKSIDAGSGELANLSVSRRRLEAEDKLQALRVRFKDNYPDVVAQIKVVEELKIQEEKALADMKSDNGANAQRQLSINPNWVSIQSEISRVQLEIATLTSSLAAHRKEISTLTQVTNQGPELEQEYKQLIRNYELNRKQYEDFVVKSGQTEVAGEAARAGSIDFEIFEPPNAAYEPAWPNRKLFFAAALFAAVFAGIGFALLPHLIFPTFDDIALLQRRFGIPVLGAVSALRTPAERGVEQRQIRHVVIAAGALVCAAGVLIVAGELGSRILQRFLA